MNHELVILRSDSGNCLIITGNFRSVHLTHFCIEHNFFYKPPEKFSVKNILGVH